MKYADDLQQLGTNHEARPDWPCPGFVIPLLFGFGRAVHVRASKLTHSPTTCPPNPGKANQLLFRLFITAVVLTANVQGQPFIPEGPGIVNDQFRVTTFASNLSFPLGMAEAPDGSLIVSSVEGNNFFSGVGRLLLFADANQDGIADGDGVVLVSNLPPALTSVRLQNRLLFVTGRNAPILVFRMSETISNSPTLAGKLVLTYPANWTQHQHSELAVRHAMTSSNAYDLYFQIGAFGNFAVSSLTVTLTNENIAGASAVLDGNSIHCITLIDSPNGLLATNIQKIATGLRNPAGFAFHPTTGDFYFQDNGIDGLEDPNEPLSADELNIIKRLNLGDVPEFFGFPSNYVSYRSNLFVGGEGIPPLVAFQPVPNSIGGEESEGANQITFAPPGFPSGLNTGIFVSFHGKYGRGGVDNEENPLVYVNPDTLTYFHFIRGQQPGIGHLDGLIATRNSLFIADLAITGNPNRATNAGAIYEIKSLAPQPPEPPVIRVNETAIELHWVRGQLQWSNGIDGPWSPVDNEFSPLTISPTSLSRFYRTTY